MHQKNILRKRYSILRKRKYFKVDHSFFLPLVNLIKKNFRKKKKLNLALYYPANFEVDVIKILDNNFIFNQNIFLPVIADDNKMSFFSWKKNQVLLVNKFGMLEPMKSKPRVPDIMLVPILSFDTRKYRLGYGKGFYDRFLNKYLNRFKNILTVGIAFSFQKHHKLPINSKDVKLNYILTEKGIY